MVFISIKSLIVAVQLFIKGSSTALLADFFMIVDGFAVEDGGFDAKSK